MHVKVTLKVYPGGWETLDHVLEDFYSVLDECSIRYTKLEEVFDHQPYQSCGEE